MGAIGLRQSPDKRIAGIFWGRGWVCPRSGLEVVTPCSVAVGYQYFGGTCCLHLHGEVTGQLLSYHNATRRHSLGLNPHRRRNFKCRVTEI